MAYKISEDCVACGTCINECPQGAISEGDIYKIDPSLCVDCGTCADVCPMGAYIRDQPHVGDTGLVLFVRIMPAVMPDNFLYSAGSITISMKFPCSNMLCSTALMLSALISPIACS